MLSTEIETAVAILREGGLVAFPTETVYGLGADATNPRALIKIFQVKQRPQDHPLIVHMADSPQLSSWAEVTPKALCLAKAFWPGPLTLILPKAPGVSDLITGGQTTVGVRVPRHPVAHALLMAFGGGVAAPSANRFGRISPTTAAAVREELGNAVDQVLEGGQCAVGVESTIVDLTGEQAVVLRPGMITAHDIALVLQEEVATHKKNAPRVSGSLELHYAPTTRTVVLTPALLPAYLNNLAVDEKPLGLLTRSLSLVAGPSIDVVRMPMDPVAYAHELYQTLRDLDKKDLRQIVIEAVPEDMAWAAIRDRLQRASRR